LLVACGGGSSSSNNSGGSGGGNNNNTGEVQAVVPVTVAQGQTVTNVNITVPTGTSTINAEVLGVTAVSSGGSAQNTGDSVKRGAVARVLMFGKGLSGALQASISGPKDIDISNIASRTATDGTPGVSFDINVHSDAALGARTVILQNTSGQITTFTGGLEVIQ
jgi:hypothetical protein